MNEIRKVYRMHAEIAQKARRHVQVLPEDLLALLEDADELERLRAAHVTERPDLYQQLARALVLAGVDRVQLDAGYSASVLRGRKRHTVSVLRAEHMGGDEWAANLRGAVESLRNQRALLPRE